MKFRLPPLLNAVPVAYISPTRLLYSDELIFHATVITPMLVVLLLPMTYIDGNWVPTVIFHDQQATFQAFLFCILGACFGSGYSMVFRTSEPKIASVTYTVAVASIATSIALFLWAAAFSGFRSCLPLLLSIVA
ncbi:hypothetical protein Pint_19092 [Pistacia integerrima]|uniref:Uncharacterized protein n=2 Tax=Pistacia TaxID=55512 RepID=A0ACC1BIY5_9ROSI|nr:hypothetical protein Pint_19092 [Pistacia integerrima]KAJ0098908.1 hypothetical protein Patl1_21794 [Pistacia atlantica]